MRNLLRSRNVRIYLFGDVISTLGDNALWLAMAIWMKELTGSSAWAGLVIFCFTLGSLFSPLGGVLADRFPRRPLLICANLLSAAVVLLILLVHGRDQMWLVYLVMFVYGVIGSATGPAETALLPQIVGEELLAEANGLQMTLTEGLRLVTPLLGAGLFAWVGGGVVAVIDAATFGVAVLSLLALRVNEPAPGLSPDGRGISAGADAVLPGLDAALPGSGAGAGPSDEAAPADEAGTAVGAAAGLGGGRFSAGFRFLLGEPVLRSITVALALVLLAMGFTESAGFSVVTVGLHHSASFVGVLMTVQGTGAVAGGVLAAWLLKRMTEPMLTALGLCTTAAAVLLLTLPNLATALVAMVLAGLVGPWLSVAATTALQRRTPPAVLGRVAGAFQLALTIPQLTSIALGAALIAVVNYRVLLVAIAVVAAIAVAYLFATPETRRRLVPAEPLAAGEPITQTTA
ncbi:MAG: MFS transporter [Trebonia sp.]|jgi:MFS family permease